MDDINGLRPEEVFLRMVEELTGAGLAYVPSTFEVDVGRDAAACAAITTYPGKESDGGDQVCLFIRERDSYRVRMTKKIPGFGLHQRLICVERDRVSDSEDGEPVLCSFAVTEARIPTPTALQRLVQEIAKFHGEPCERSYGNHELIELGLLDPPHDPEAAANRDYAHG